MCTNTFFPIFVITIVVFCLVQQSYAYTVNARKTRAYDDESISVDVMGDIYPPKWDIVKPWFEYTNDSFDLQDIVGEKYPEVDEDFDWNQFSGANGIWATFYQKYPPQIGLKPPSISHSSQRPYLNLKIRYYLYGTNASIHVYSSEKLLGKLEYRCEEVHCEGFEEDTVALSDKEGSTGAHNFNVTLVTKNPGEFILIDSITAGGGGVTLAPPTTESDCNCECDGWEQSLDDSVDPHANETWLLNSFSYYNSTGELDESEVLLPWNFDPTPLGNVSSVWLALRDEESTQYGDENGRFFIKFKDSMKMHDGMELTYYLGSPNSSLSIFVTKDPDDNEDGNDEDEEFESTPVYTIRINSTEEGSEDDGEGGWKVLRLSLNETRGILIQADLPNNGDFVLIDKLLIQPYFPSSCYGTVTTEMYSSSLSTIETSSLPSSSISSSSRSSISMTTADQSSSYSSSSSSSSMGSSTPQGSTGSYSADMDISTSEKESWSTTSRLITTPEHCDCSTRAPTTTTTRKPATPKPPKKSTTTKEPTTQQETSDFASTDKKSTSGGQTTSKMTTTTTNEPGTAAFSNSLCTHLLIASFIAILLSHVY